MIRIEITEEHIRLYMEGAERYLRRFYDEHPGKGHLIEPYDVARAGLETVARNLEVLLDFECDQFLDFSAVLTGEGVHTPAVREPCRKKGPHIIHQTENGTEWWDNS